MKIVSIKFQNDIDSKNILIAVGKEINSQRGRCGLSRTDLARKSGVTVSQIRTLENGGGGLSMLICLKLSTALGIKFSEVMRRID